MVSTLSLELEVVTPLFLGGAGQQAELRAPSLKGLLRFWYRAIDPRFSERGRSGAASREERFFGSSRPGAGQSPFLLRMSLDRQSAGSTRKWRWDRAWVEQFREGRGRESRSGVAYLGWPFQAKGGERDALAPATRVKVECVFPRGIQGEQHEQRQALAAAVWLLGHLGGLGSRSRRGFGSLALRGWDPSGGDWPELAELPLLSELSTAEAWRAEFQKARSVLARWFDSYERTEARRQPHLGPASRWWLSEVGYPAWDRALDALGRQLQDYRVRREPDYGQVKEHLRARSRQGGRFLERAPERAAFGLPLAFRYSSLEGESVTFVPFDPVAQATAEREGSLLQLRVAALKDGFHPLFVRLDGEVPGKDNQVAARGQRRPLRRIGANALDDFMNSLGGRRR
jgi:CRISPR-associated protein Cmr1